MGGEGGSSGGEGHLEDNVQWALSKEGTSWTGHHLLELQDTFFSVHTKQPIRQPIPPVPTSVKLT